MTNLTLNVWLKVILTAVPLTGNGVLIDNWDLSVKRSTSIIRVLTDELNVNPAQLIAAGRSSYVL
jgi:chemotaxis protein MotB